MTESSSVLHVHKDSVCKSGSKEVRWLWGTTAQKRKEKERFSSWLFLDTKGHAVEATLVT